MSGGLTKKQRELLAFLRSYIAQHDGVAPSYDEMVVASNLKTKSGVHRLLEALEERGFIRRIPNRARCIFLVDEQASIFQPEQASEFQRGRSVGFAEGYRDAIRRLGRQRVIERDAA